MRKIIVKFFHLFDRLINNLISHASFFSRLKKNMEMLTISYEIILCVSRFPFSSQLVLSPSKKIFSRKLTIFEN